MEPDKVVIHFKDGNILKGKTKDFFPNKKTFHLNLEDSQTKEVNVEKLKALFFVKDLKGDNNYVYEYGDDVSGGGKKIAVDFSDGETIVGYVLSYSPQRQGFMMTPANLEGNNDRIFVVNSAIKSVDFLTEGQPLPKTPKAKSQDLHIKKVEEKRKFPRVTSVKLLSYVCFDEEGNPSEQGMGNTLDISLGGLLLETNVPIESRNILLQATNIREELIEIKGQVVYSRQSKPKIFHAGISFREKKERAREIVVDLIKLN
jgi:hypothetical protein